MFALTHGVSEAEWRSNPSVRFNNPPLPLELQNSDEDSSGTCGDKSAGFSSGWVSGEEARDAAKAAGFWPDGARVGRGHGQPYLQPHWAKQIREGLKTYEGRPREGVSPPSHPLSHRPDPDPDPNPRPRVRRQWVTQVEANDYVTFKISGSGGRVLCCRVRGVQHYTTFLKMLVAVGVSRMLPGSARDAVEGAAVYYSFSNRKGVPYHELEKMCGVVAIHLEVLGGAPVDAEGAPVDAEDAVNILLPRQG